MRISMTPKSVSRKTGPTSVAAFADGLRACSHCKAWHERSGGARANENTLLHFKVVDELHAALTR